MGTPSHEGGVHCDSSLWFGRGEGGANLDFKRIRQPCEGGQHSPRKGDHGTYIIPVGSVDREESRLKAINTETFMPCHTGAD